MSRQNETRYGRACLLVLNICPFTLRRTIDDNFVRQGSLSLQDLLEKNKHPLFHLLTRTCCCRNRQSKASPLNRTQWDSLYIKNHSSCAKGQRGECPCQYDAKPGITTNIMDITLCCLIITNICVGINMSHITTIREIRNKLIHAESASLDEQTFYDYWNKVKTAIIDIASHVSTTLHSETLKMVQELESQVMNVEELAQELRRLLVNEKTFLDLKEDVSSISENVNILKEVQVKSSKMLEAAACKVTEIEGSVCQTRKDVDRLQTDFDIQRRELQTMREDQERYKERNSDDAPNIDYLKEKMLEINGDITKDIPITPIKEKGDDELPIELLYASVVIREDPAYIKKRRNFSSTSETDNTASASYRPSIEYVEEGEPYSDSSDDEENISGQNKDVKQPADVFMKNGKKVKNIFLLGDAAHGKTTFCIWLLKNWCNAIQTVSVGTKTLKRWEKAMSDFDFVFLLPLRHMNPNRVSVIDMICQDVFGRDQGCHPSIRHVLSSDQYRSLIIIDGLDEWNPNEGARGQLTCQGMPNIENVSSKVSCLFSMRPWVFPSITKIVKNSDIVLEILGLSRTGMKKVIKNVLLNHYNLEKGSTKYTDTYNKILGHLQEKNLISFMQIPLLAVVCVQIWYEGKQMGNSITSFYADMLNMLIERACQNHEFFSDDIKTIPFKLPETLSKMHYIAKFFPVLLKLGKVAFHSLSSDDTKLSFQKSRLEAEIGADALEFALNVGLISQKEAKSILTRNVFVHFFHKSIQEFLAAVYIVTRIDVSEFFCFDLFNMKIILELSNVIMFICGISPSLGSAISQRVISVTDSDVDFCEYRKSPRALVGEKIKELFKLQVTWNRELKYRKKDDPIIFHVSDVYLWGGYSDIDTVSRTKELLIDQYLTIKSIWFYGVSTDKEKGITNAEFNSYLSSKFNSRSLVRLYIYGSDTNRIIRTISGPKLKTVILSDLKTTPIYDYCMLCPPLLTSVTHLKILSIRRMDLGERILGSSFEMTSIEQINLNTVRMTNIGWKRFLDMISTVKHTFDVFLFATNIDDKSKEKIRLCSLYSVTKDLVQSTGEYVLKFTKV